MKVKITLSIILLLAVLVTACSPITPLPEQTAPTAQAEKPAEVAPVAPPAEEGQPAETPAETTGPKYGGTVVGFVSSDPMSFDPATISTWDQSVIATNLLEGLFRLSPDGTVIENAIAESYEVSSDGLTWTFKIRSNAKFHNGRQIVAEDFKYSFERVLNPETKSPRAWMLDAVVGAQDFRDGTAQEVSGIKVVDPQTLSITLSQPLAPFKSMLASANLAVVPKEEVENFGEEFGSNVVAAGPFKLGEWNMNLDLTLDSFEDYWGGRPYVDAVKFRFIGDENTRIIEFDAQNLDIAWVPPAHWDRFNADPVLKEKLGWAYTFHTEFWAINLEKEPFGNNLALRQAIRYAIDLDAVVESLQNRAAVAQGILPAGLLGFNPDNEIYYPMNLDKAKELMKEAGYENGLPGTYDVILPPWGNEIKLHEIYQANLKEIGININLVPTEFGPYLEALDAGDFDIAWMYRVTDYADPDGFYYPLLHSDNIGPGGNWARFANADVDQLIEEARAALTDEERASLYGQADEKFAEVLPYIPLFHNVYVEGVQPYVMDYVPSPMDTHMFHRVWLDK